MLGQNNVMKFSGVIIRFTSMILGIIELLWEVQKPKSFLIELKPQKTAKMNTQY